MRKTLCMVLMIALVLVSILAIAVVPASAASSTDKALMLVANKGNVGEGNVTVTLQEPVALDGVVSFDIDNGEGLKVKVGSYTLDTADTNGTYRNYKLEITANAITLSALKGSAFEVVDSETIEVALTEAQVVGFSLSNSDVRAKTVFIDNLVVGSEVFDFNYKTETEGRLGTVYANKFSISALGDSYSYIPQDDFVVSFYDIDNGGQTVVTAYYGYGKKVSVPAGYKLVDSAESYKIDKVEADAFIALTSATDNLLGGVYVRLVNATFKDGAYAGETIGVFQVGDEVTAVADPAVGGATFHGFYTGKNFDDNTTPVCSEQEYTFEVTGNTVVAVDYNLQEFDVLLGNYDVGFEDKVVTEELGDTIIYTASNRAGYTFDGWYADEAFETLVTSDRALTVTFDSEQAYYAKYTAIPYSVFVATGGRIKVDGEKEGDPAVYTYNGIYGDSVTVVADEPKEGESFVGWYAGAIKLSDSEEYTFSVTGNLSLSAKYEVNPVKVTVLSGVVAEIPSESSEDYVVTVKKGETITVIPEVREGHEFLGWQVGCAAELSQHIEYNCVINSDITIKAIYDDYVTVTVTNATILGHADESAEEDIYKITIPVQQITVVPLEGYTFTHWEVFGANEGEDSELVWDVQSDVMIEAIYSDYPPVEDEGGNGEGGNEGGNDGGEGGETPTEPAGGCGGFIAPVGPNGSNGGNGGMFMILGVLAIAVLAVVVARHGKKMVKHAPKVLGVVLCLAVLCGAVVVPEAVATTDEVVEAPYEDTTITIMYNDTANEGVHDYVDYFYVDGFKLGDKVKVSMDVNINRTSENVEGWSVSVFKNLGGEMIDDALPLNTWTHLVYETRVVSAPEGLAVALTSSIDGYLEMQVKDITVTTSKLEASLLGGATLYMLPNDIDTTSEQMNSFVLVTASGKVIVMDGGTFKDYAYLRDFLRSITTEVDAWFISHYHSDHIGALALILYNRDVKIKNLYYDFPPHAELWGPVVDESMVVSGTFDFNFSTLEGLVQIIGGFNSGNSGTIVGNFLSPKYTPKYGDGSSGEGAKSNDKSSALYLMFYDEVQRNLALPQGDANRIIDNVVETQRGDVFKFDDVEFLVLNDVLRTSANYGNNTTINWRINTAGIDMLFLGDSGTQIGDKLINDKELIFDTDGDNVKDASVYDSIFGCTIVQAAHHGQSGVSESFYHEVEGDIYIYCAPEDLFYSKDGNGLMGLATTQCVKEREWQRQMDTVSRTYWMDGLVTIR